MMAKQENKKLVYVTEIAYTEKTRLTFTRTLTAKSPNTAPDAPTETAFLGSTSHETRFAPAPVRIYESHNAKFPSSSSTSFPGWQHITK